MIDVPKPRAEPADMLTVGQKKNEKATENDGANYCNSVETGASDDSALGSPLNVRLSMPRIDHNLNWCHNHLLSRRRV